MSAQMIPKLTMMFVLFGTVIGLSHLNDDNLDKLKQQMLRLRRRETRLPWRKT